MTTTLAPLLAYTLLGLMLTLGSSARAEDLVVITHPDSGVEHLSREEVTNIFLGRYKKLPSGLSARPTDTLTHKELFYARLVNKPLTEINAYWARLVFSGATSPPSQSSDDQATLQLVGSQSGAIGYVERSKVSKQVRIVFELTPP